MVLYKELMSEQKTSKISVVIPCYNEQCNIARCLDALKSQSVQPFEVIIVDNNCIDKTVKIALSYQGVRVLKEVTQGLVTARNTGLNAAKGEIIARIDADTIPAEDWIAKITETMSDDRVQAVTGTGYFYDAPCKRLVKTTRNIFAVWLNKLVLGHHMLWGSNMAIRTTAWQAIKDECCIMADIMEDLDIAAHINKRFGKKAVTYRAKIRADISARRAMVTLKNNWLYLKMWPRTMALHNYQRRVLIWPAIGVLLALVGAGSKIARFYNAEQDRMIFSLKQWRDNPLYDRLNP